MTLVVEDGTGLATANGYVATADADVYHATRGNAAWAGPSDAKSAAIIRATAYVDAGYRARFPGYRFRGRLQGLEWPRIAAFVVTPDNGRSNAWLPGYGTDYGATYGYPGVDFIAANVVPSEIVNATCEAALRELVTPGSLAPDMSRDDRLKVFEVGPVHFEYFGGAAGNPNTTFQAIDLALASLLLPPRSFSGVAVRG